MAPFAVRLRVPVNFHSQQNRLVVDLQPIALRSVRLRPRHRLRVWHEQLFGQHHHVRRSCLERDLHACTSLAIAFAHVEVSDTVSNVGLDAEELAVGFGAKLLGGCDESVDILLLGTAKYSSRSAYVAPRNRIGTSVAFSASPDGHASSFSKKSSMSRAVSAYTSVSMG
ncbi:hypothetical protein GQ600_5997 [Phytophthora cactorum]|nr:hypothetical protein GQ600_5997 [Phytophthora cactorum]